MKLVICGGGISGLSSAFYASKALSRICGKENFKIVLLEKGENVGGWMQTWKPNEEDGPINELGPASIRISGKKAALIEKNTLELVHEIGQGDYILPVKADNIATKNRLIYVNKRLHLLPSSFISIFKTTTPFSRPIAVSLLASLFTKVGAPSETVDEVFRSRFGDEMADYLASSFARGVFSADSKHLSLKAAFPSLWKLLLPSETAMPRRPSVSDPHGLNSQLSQHPLVRRAGEDEWRMWRPSEGFEHFTQSFSSFLERGAGVEVRRGCHVVDIRRGEDGKMTTLVERDGEQSCVDGADHVISALPSFALAEILSRGADDDPDSVALRQLARMLRRIRWLDVAVVNVEYSGQPSHNLPMVGFGHLVPSVEPSDVLGVRYDSCAFPAHDRRGPATTQLTCMIGGSWYDEVLGLNTFDPATAERVALESISKQLGITKEPMNVNASLCKKCLPLYRVGHTDLVEKMEDFISNRGIPISLVGSSYWGVSVNDCIYNSRANIDAILSKDKPARMPQSRKESFITSHSMIARLIKQSLTRRTKA